MMGNLRATMLDQAGWFAPYIETSTAEGYAWARTGAVHSFPNIPEMSFYPLLVEEFRERGPRPG